MNRTSGLFSIVLTAALASACGHQAGASAAGASAESPAAAANDTAAAQAQASASHADGAILDACSLISPDDAAGILGTPAQLAEHAQDDKEESHCQYNAANQNTSGFNSLMVKIHTDEDANEARASFAIQQKMAAANAYESLTGIGDGAILITNKPPEGTPVDLMQDAQTLYLIKGAKDIMVSTQFTGKPRSADSLKALAKKLADHF